MSKLDEFFAFKIGDVVRPKVHRVGFDPNGKEFRPAFLVIVERTLQECYGGIQAHYQCRTHSTVGEWGAQWGWAVQLIPMTEPELVLAELPELTSERVKRE